MELIVLTLKVLTLKGVFLRTNLLSGSSLSASELILPSGFGTSPSFIMVVAIGDLDDLAVAGALTLVQSDCVFVILSIANSVLRAQLLQTPFSIQGRSLSL